MPQWPVTLPVSPLLDNFHETLPATVLRTEMEQGPAKVRQRTTAAIRKISFGYLLNSAQAGILDNFYTTTLSGGALAFDFSHPRTGDTLSCRFINPPEYAAVNGSYYRVLLSLEILP